MMARMGDAMAQASFTGATRRAWLAAAACALASGLLSPAMADPSAQQYDMVLHKSEPKAIVAVVTLDPRFILQVISTVPERDGWVRSLVARTNRIKTLHVDAPPPADAPHFAMASKPIGRGDARFKDALFLELRKYYDVELRVSGK